MSHSNTETLEKFYRDNYNILVKMTSNRVGGMENAEDVVQEAFLRAVTYLDTYDPDRVKFSTWFNPILKRAMYDFKRVETRQGMALQSYEEEATEELPWDAESEAIQEEIRKLIESKPDNHRAVLSLAFLQGYPRRAIVEITDEGAENVGKILTRFKNELGEIYVQ